MIVVCKRWQSLCSDAIDNDIKATTTTTTTNTSITSNPNDKSVQLNGEDKSLYESNKNRFKCYLIKYIGWILPVCVGVESELESRVFVCVFVVQ